MSDCKVYPADTVDIYGNVWSTSYKLKDVKADISVLYTEF